MILTRMNSTTVVEVSNINCICNELSKIGIIKGFNTPNEYKRLERYLNSLVIEIKLKTPILRRDYFYSNVYECIECGEKWVLTEPDFPFRGVWGRKEEIFNPKA